MHRYDIETSYFWFALGVFITVKAVKLGIGELSNPKPGFIFFLSGILLCILSIIVFTSRILSRKKLPPESLWSGVNWHKPVLILAALFLYASFFQWLGFLITCFLFTFFLFKIIGRLRWPVSVLNASLCSTGAYFIFKVLLKLSLPKGILPI